MAEHYEQLDIFGGSDLQYAEDTAIKLLQEFEPLALQKCPEHGYIVGYSGGKDSDCLVHLFIRSGVKFKLIHNHTTLDIPETVRYVKRKFEEWAAKGIECERYMPERSFWKICEDKAMLPMRFTRFCCEELKEKQPYFGAVYSFGVRKFESVGRANNRDSIETRNTKSFKKQQRFHFDKSEDTKVFETCYRNHYNTINPMAYWTTEVRDKYIAKYNIEVNPVYEKYGLKRCGCVMCPMCSDEERQREAEMFPKYALNFRLLCDRIAQSPKKIKPVGGGNYTDVIYTYTSEELYNGYLKGSIKSLRYERLHVMCQLQAEYKEGTLNKDRIWDYAHLIPVGPDTLWQIARGELSIREYEEIANIIVDGE